MTNSAKTSVGNKAREGFLWLLSTTVIWQIISWAFTLVTARLLLPEDYGIISLGESLSPYFIMIATFRIETWLVQRSEITQSDEKATLLLMLVLGVICSSAGLALGPILGHFYNDSRVIQPFQVLSSIFLLRALCVIPESRLRRQLDFRTISISNLIIGIARGALQVLLAYYGYGFWSLVAGAVFKEVSTLLWYVSVAGTPIRPAISLVPQKEALRYGTAATLASVFWIFFSSADNIIVGKLFGVDKLGFYSMAFFLADLPLSKVNSVLNQILIPFFGKLRDSKEELALHYLNLNRWTVSILSPILFGIFALRSDIVAVVLGPKWIGLEEPLGVMCLAGLYRALPGNASILFYAVGKPGIPLKWSIFVSVLLVPAFYILGTLFGIWGVYSTWIFLYPVVGVFPMFLLISRYLAIPLTVIFRALIPSLVSATIMVTVLSSFEIHEFSLRVLIARILFGAVVYTGVMGVLFNADLRKLVREGKEMLSLRC